MSSSAGITGLIRLQLTIASLAAFGVASAFLIVTDSPFLRLVIALIVAFGLIAAIDVSPRMGMVMLVLFLISVGLLRRMLMLKIGWSANDPLLLVGPLVAGVTLIRLFLRENRVPGGDAISIAMVALFFLTCAQSLNPRNGSIAIGLGGVLFMAVPMAWYFIGRELVDTRAARAILGMIVVLGVVIGAYGLVQTRIGLPSWDSTWALAADYSALFKSDGSANSFGSFASTAEFSIFVAIALVASVAFGLYGRPIALAAVPVLAVALFLSSYRGAVVLALAAIFALVLMRVAPPRWAPFALVLGMLSMVFLAPMAMAGLGKLAGSSGDANVEYQLSGLSDPFNSETSTVPLHLEMFREGIVRGITDPLGRGSGTTSNAARLGEGSASQTTEVDISNSFVSLGLFGGLLFITVLLLAFRDAFGNHLARPDAVSAAVLGILVVTLGNWLSGGHYATVVITWIVVGYSAQRRFQRVGRGAENPRPRLSVEAQVPGSNRARSGGEPDAALV